MIREDRELLAELARLNGDMASLGLRVMEGSASAAEQRHYAQRLIAVGERLQRRADGMGSSTVIEGEVVVEAPVALPARTIELDTAAPAPHQQTRAMPVLWRDEVDVAVLASAATMHRSPGTGSCDAGKP